MKKYLSTTLLLLSAIMFSCAQTNTQDKRVSKIMGDLQQACQMSADQSAKVQPMVQNFVSIAADNKQKYAGDKDARKSANEANRKNFKANLATVLSADQITQYEQYMKQHRKAPQQQQGNDEEEKQ